MELNAGVLLRKTTLCIAFKYLSYINHSSQNRTQSFHTSSIHLCILICNTFKHLKLKKKNECN